jgi:hypothetical protein
MTTPASDDQQGVERGRRAADNRHLLVTVTARAYVAPTRLLPELAQPDRDGLHRLLPGNGGISLGVHVGDLVGSDQTSDHLTPGACLEADPSTPTVVGDVHLLACIGNPVFDGCGNAIGVIAGKRGGLAPGFWGPTHLVVEVSDEAADRLTPGDPVSVRTRGRGLTMPADYGIEVFNCDPTLLDHLAPEGAVDRLDVPVRAVVGSAWAGAGLGQDAWIGDLEITDRTLLPSDLRFGDLVAITDLDAAADRSYRAGYVGIGVVSHGPSARPGHGIGVTLLLGGPESRLVPVLTDAGHDVARSPSIGAVLARMLTAITAPLLVSDDHEETI